MADQSYNYIGNELELFSAATNWKRYIAEILKPYIKGNVLEVGAGIATNTPLFFTDKTDKWVLLEPDISLLQVIQKLLSEKKLPEQCTVFNGYSSDLKETEQFDCILYIDVLEHIQNDKAEINTATNLLKKGGYLLVLSPAHQYLMSPFDHAIGHYRRYSKKTLAATANEKLLIEKIIYTDTIGYFASLANKLLLKQQYPTKKQIHFWDTWMVPLSKWVDRIFFYKTGKTVIGIWKKK